MEAMEVLHRCCCGMDVHKDSVVACVRRIDAAGRAGDHAHVRHNHGGALGTGRLAGERAGAHRGDGIDGGVLEADLEFVGGPG